MPCCKVLILWYCVKHSLQRRRQTPYQRGLYERMFDDLEDEYPSLWTANQGAVDDVKPEGLINRLKWRLLKRWFAPNKTINKRLYSSLMPQGETDELGTLDRCKRYLLLKWLPQILRETAGAEEDVEMGSRRASLISSSGGHNDKDGVIIELAKSSTSVALADAEPAPAQQVWAYGGLQPLFPRVPRASGSAEKRSSSITRPGSRGSSGIMVEERNLSDSESEVGEGVHAGASAQPEERGRRSSR